MRSRGCCDRRLVPAQQVGLREDEYQLVSLRAFHGGGRVVLPAPRPLRILSRRASRGSTARGHHGDHFLRLGYFPLFLSQEDEGEVILKAAVGLSTDFTDFTDGLEQEAPLLRCFHVARGVKRQRLSTGFQSVETGNWDLETGNSE